MDSNHDIVQTLRLFDGVMTGIAADEIEALRKRVAELEAAAVSPATADVQCKCRRLGDYDGYRHHPLCPDAPAQAEPGVVTIGKPHHFTAAAPAPARDQFSYALRKDAERWTGPFDSVEDAIEDALSNVLGDERAATVVWIATNAPLDIDCDSLADDVIERIQEQAYDEVGEVADTIGPFEAAETKLLSNAIKQWIDEYGEISCYKIENPKAYGPGAPEHNAALTRGVGDTR